MGNYGVRRIWSAVWPVLLYHVVSIGVYRIMILLSGENNADAAPAAVLTACLMLPVLVRERLHEKAVRKRMEGQTACSRKDLQRGKGRNLTGIAAGMQPHQKSRLFIVCIASFAAGALLSILSSWIMTRLGLYERFGNTAQEALMTASFPMQVFGLGMIIPIAEEYTFRGLLHSRLKTITGTMYALFASSLLFAVIHGNIIQFLYAFPMGCILCLSYECAEGNLAAPVLMHMGANLVSVFFQKAR